MYHGDTPCTRAAAWPVFAQRTHKHRPQARKRWVQAEDTEKTMKLIEQKCRPIKAGAPPLSRKEAEDLLLQIPAWSLDKGELHREFKFRDFRQAIDFVNKVAEIANTEDHHPDILISYNKVRIILSTHKIVGLSLNDFIVAAKINLVPGNQISEKAA